MAENIVALIENNEIRDFFGNAEFCMDRNFENGGTLLTMAVKSGNLQHVESVVNKGGNVNKRETAGATPLLLAVYLNNLEIVKFLVSKGAWVNIGDSFETPLMLATRKSFLAIIEFLLSKGADINIPNLDAISPLFWAIKEEKLAALETLISGGIPPNIKKLSGDSPLIYAVKLDSSKEIIQCLLKHGADVNEAPLSWAAEIGRLDLVKILVNYGADCDRTDVDGNTPLASAVRYRRNDIVKYLISQNVNVCKVGKNGKTPLLWAVENEDLHLVDYLLDHGAIFIIDSVFLPAISVRNLEIVKCLHQREAYKDKKYKINDVTPLAKALQVKSYEIAFYLLENGCTLDDLEDHDMLYLLMFLEIKDHQMVQLLTKYGTKLDKIEARSGHTPLTKSVAIEDFQMVAYFIQNGASVNLPNKHYKTPLAVAADVENFRIFQFLVKNGADLEMDRSKNDEKMIRYYQIAMENISKEKLVAFIGDQEAAEEVKIEEIFEETCEEKTKEKTLTEKNYYVIGNLVTGIWFFIHAIFQNLTERRWLQ